jgi:hypothetical protein
MSHDIFGERFLSYRLVPWHRVGLVVQNELRATEAWQKLGPFTVTVEPILVPGMTVSGIGSHRAIVRHPTQDDPQYRLFGLVSDRYRLVTMDEVVELADRFIGRPVETIGALGHGETCFLTYEMPAISVSGDEVKNYILIDVDMSGSMALHVRLVPERVVCRNTLMLARSLQVEAWSLRHEGDVIGQLSSILDGLYDRQIEKVAAVKEAFEILAQARISRDTAVSVLEKLYPDPSQEKRRDAVLLSWNGLGMGSDSPGYRETAWGLFNAVVEIEDYGGRRSSTRLKEVFDTGVKEKAYQLILSAI